MEAWEKGLDPSQVEPVDECSMYRDARDRRKKTYFGPSKRLRLGNLKPILFPQDMEKQKATEES